MSYGLILVPEENDPSEEVTRLGPKTSTRGLSHFGHLGTPVTPSDDSPNMVLSRVSTNSSIAMDARNHALQS